MLKETMKEKWKGVQAESNYFRSWSRPIRVLSDVPASRIDVKLCQIYTKICIHKILYKNSVINRLYSANTQPIWKRQYPRGA